MTKIISDVRFEVKNERFNAKRSIAVCRKYYLFARVSRK